MIKRALVFGIFLLSAVIGVGAFLYPFILPAAAALEDPTLGANSQAPAMTMILLAFTLAVLLLEVQGQATSSKIVAALGVLIAATSVLRFVEVAIPGPGGFSPIFVPIIIAGYVFGPRFGFLMGTLTLFVSGLLTGGIGPWVPYQMFAAGWVGLTAGLLPEIDKPIGQLTMLVLFAVVWGFLYGFIMNLFFWPFMNPMTSTGVLTAGGLRETISGYGAFYLTTSLIWDLTRAAGNAVLMLVLGLPSVRALQRFHDKFQFQVVSG